MYKQKVDHLVLLKTNLNYTHEMNLAYNSIEHLILQQVETPKQDDLFNNFFRYEVPRFLGITSNPKSHVLDFQNSYDNFSK